MSARTLLGAVAIAGLALGAPPASATFHLMKIREVYPGSSANPGSEYVELQMWAEDQNHVGGHVLRSYGAGGAVTGVSMFPADVPQGANQSTMVLATPEAEAQFGILADAPLQPSGQLDPAAGAVCWEGLDCASWGDFGGSLTQPRGFSSRAGRHPRRHGPAPHDRPRLRHPARARRRPRRQRRRLCRGLPRPAPELGSPA